MKALFKGIALCLAMLMSVVLFFTKSPSVYATDVSDSSDGNIVTDLSNPDFGEITEIVLPDSISGTDASFDFGFGFHINDAESFPDGTFTYTLPSDLDFSEITDTHIKVSRDETEIGYAITNNENVITFYLDPENFKADPNGIDGSVAITCKLGKNISDSDSEAEIKFSDTLTYKILINKPEEPENPEKPTPETPEDPENPAPAPADDPTFTATLTKATVTDENGKERDSSTGIVKWASTLTVNGESEEGFNLTIIDTIKPSNSGEYNVSWLNGKEFGARIVTDSVKIIDADGVELENAQTVYNKNSFTTTFENIKSGDYTITYETFDYYGSTDKHTFPGGNIIAFTNKIKSGTPGIDASATAKYKIEAEGLPMKKVSSAGKYDNELKTYVIPWTVYVNQNTYNQSISSIENGANAIITDTLPEYLHYKIGSSTLTSSNANSSSLEPSIINDGSREKLTWEYNWETANDTATIYKINFETYVDKDYYEKLINSTESGTVTLTFYNTARGIVGNSEGYATGSSNDKIKVLEKKASFDEKTQLLNFSIVVNEKGLNLNNGNDISLSDEVTNGTFIPSSFKVYDFNTKDEISISEDKVLFSQHDSKMSASIPDGKALIIKYSVKPDTKAGVDAGNGKVIVEISNNAVLYGTSQKKAGTHDKYKMNKVSANVTSKSGSITITKADKSNPDKKLDGAVIGLYRVNLSNGETQLVSSKTTSAPFGFVKFSEDGSYSSLIFDTLYYYQELGAPEGYKLDDTKHYFIFASSKYNKIKDQIASIVKDSELKVINVKTNGTEYEAVLENEVKPAPAEDPKKDTPAQPTNSDNGNSGNTGNTSSENNNSNSDSTADNNNNSSNNDSTNQTAENAQTPAPVTQAATRTTALLPSVNANLDLPEVLGAYNGGKESTEVPDLPVVLSARRSETGDTNTTRNAVWIILASIAVLTGLLRKNKISV